MLANFVLVSATTKSWSSKASNSGAGRATSLDQELPPAKKIRKSSQAPIASTFSKGKEIEKMVKTDDPILGVISDKKD